MKKLYYGFHFVAGRSNGRITSYHRGGGTKKRYLFIDRFRVLYQLPAKVISFLTVSGSCRKVALLLYSNGIISFIPATVYLEEGDYVSSSFLPTSDLNLIGSAFPLSTLKLGTRVSSVELYPGFGSAVARAPGLFATVIRKYVDLVLLRLSSGEFRFFLSTCFCTVGANQAPHKGSFSLNAGYSRRLGKRPVVRGRAMNPVDHPHGGRTNGGMVPTTPWARHVKGQKTSRSVTSLRLKVSKI